MRRPALWRRVVRALRDRLGLLLGEHQVVSDGRTVYYVNRHGQVVREESIYTYRRRWS